MFKNKVNECEAISAEIIIVLMFNKPDIAQNLHIIKLRKKLKTVEVFLELSCP